MCNKIGVISLFYNSHNYGGLLQAYALIFILHKNQFSSEQIKFDDRFKCIIPHKRKITLKKIIKFFLSKMIIAKKNIVKLCMNRLQKKCENNVKLRNYTLDGFANEILSSDIIYTNHSLKDCIDKYDVFITGSDQVWNMSWYNSGYFLHFVPNCKYKFSYAASMPNTNLTSEQENIVKEHLKDFKAISVREKKTAEYLTKLLNRKVEWVLDPTLILEKSDWDEICSERLISEKYIFCYFLGNDKKMRKETEKFAKKMNLQIVTLPHLCGVNFSDVLFGDKKLYDVSPEEFVSLIKYAEYVVTDSFHACVFSNIYNVKYFVFSRKGAGEMDERIISLLDMFNSEKRFVKENQKEYLYNNRNLEVNMDFSKYNKMKIESKKFLFENLKNAGMDIKYEN